MPLRIVGVSITAVLLVRVSKAETSEIPRLVPESVESTVSLGMSGTELAVSRPGARLVTGNLKSGNLIEFLSEDGPWDSVMYCIREGRLAFVSFTRGGVRQTGTAEMIGPVLSRGIAEYGAQFERKVERSTYRIKQFLSPILVWRKPHRNVFVRFIPARNIKQGEKAMIRLTLAARDIPINQLFQLPDPATETRFIEDDFATVLSVHWVGSSAESIPGVGADLPQKRGDGEPPAVSRTPGGRSDSTYVMVGVGMAVSISLAGAWLLLRRRSGG